MKLLELKKANIALVFAYVQRKVSIRKMIHFAIAPLQFLVKQHKIHALKRFMLQAVFIALILENVYMQN
jgi:hypothetical protein